MGHYGKIKNIKEDEEGTTLTILIPGENLLDKIIRTQTYDAEVMLNDGRTISIDQRKKIFATIRDIADYRGELPEWYKEFLKYDYCIENGVDIFSLSNCSLETARDFITHIIEYALKEDIPLMDLAINRVEDIDRYLYNCIKHRRCCLCGKPADIHHEDAIGMGNDRTTYDDSEHKKIALCRTHHSEAHQIGVVDFYNKYHVYGIICNE